ncbi:uncharacterized protein LOC144100873 [Amblyomma americanum]
MHSASLTVIMNGSAFATSASPPFLLTSCRRNPAEEGSGSFHDNCDNCGNCVACAELSPRVLPVVELRQGQVISVPSCHLKCGEQSNGDDHGDRAPNQWLPKLHALESAQPGTAERRPHCDRRGSLVTKALLTAAWLRSGVRVTKALSATPRKSAGAVPISRKTSAERMTTATTTTSKELYAEDAQATQPTCAFRTAPHIRGDTDAAGSAMRLQPPCCHPGASPFTGRLLLMTHS